MTTCPACGFVLSSIHGDEWWCERCPWDGCPLHPTDWGCALTGCSFAASPEGGEPRG
jgi:hypothetical protein